MLPSNLLHDMSLIIDVLTSFVDTSHAISVEDASCPFTKHLISDLVHLQNRIAYTIEGYVIQIFASYNILMIKF